jgi:phosphatidylglycerol:prolipoprotein diacylglycerol transferase
MHPIICRIGPFTFYAYGLALVLAFLASVSLAMAKAKRENINPEVIFNFCFFNFVFGILGSRIFYILENADYYYRNPLEIIMLQEGGLSWFGGLILAILFSLFYLKSKKMSVCGTLDLIAPFLALGQAIGRVGCLLNGCCFGKISDFGLYFEAHKATLIPTQIYSSLILVLIFITLRIMQDRPHPKGQIFLIYLLLYALKRFFIEFLRADNPIIFLGLTLFQALSIILFLSSIVGIILINRKANKLHT